jgi:hypothetical protein
VHVSQCPVPGQLGSIARAPFVGPPADVATVGGTFLS